MFAWFNTGPGPSLSQLLITDFILFGIVLPAVMLLFWWVGWFRR